MEFSPPLSLTFNDIGLKPLWLSSVKSRKDVNLKTNFLNKNLNFPVIVSPMQSVVDWDFVLHAEALKLVCCLPRGNNFKSDLDLYIKLKNHGIFSIPSVPAVHENLENIYNLYLENGASHFCIDVANGFHDIVGSSVRLLKKLNKEVKIITGNVASLEGYQYLANEGVDAIRVGIGNGSVCSTSIATGIGVGQATLIREIADYTYSQSTNQPLIIADGGVKTPGDVAKALALGSDVVMAGGMFVRTYESASETITKNDNNGIPRAYKNYSGQASAFVKNNNKNVEGVTRLVQVESSLEDVVKSIKDGLASSLSYMGVDEVSEFKYLPNEVFVRLSHGASIERNPHA